VIRCFNGPEEVDDLELAVTNLEWICEQKWKYMVLTVWWTEGNCLRLSS